MTGSYFSAHAHGIYSTLDGHAMPEEYAAKIKAQGHTHIALTDHGTMAGLPALWKTARTHALVPVAGLEAYVTSQPLTERIPEAFHLTLLAVNAPGYSNLSALSSLAHLEGFYYKPRVDHPALARYSDGVVCLSGCIGSELAHAILGGNSDRAEFLLRFYQEIYGDRFFLELQNHGDHIPDQQKLNRELLAYSLKYGIPAVGTNDSHYCQESDGQAQRYLMAITMGKQGLTMGSPYTWVRSNEEMAAAFPDQLLRNTLAIAEMVEPYALGDETPRIPHSPWETKNGAPEQILEARVKLGLMSRLGAPSWDDLPLDYQVQAEHELDVIAEIGTKLGVAIERYFLNVGALTEYLDHAKIRFSTRGSAAGSVVCWALGISSLDPLAHGLYFERFLNPHRVDLPDIDLDVPDTRRDEVLQWLQRTYGIANVARIGTYNKIAPRRAIQDACRLLADKLSRDYQEVMDDLTGLVPHSANPSEQTFAEIFAEDHAPLQLARETQRDAALVLDVAEQIAGRLRGQSTHAAGVIIADRPVYELAPVARVSKPEKEIVQFQTQFEMASLPDLGLIKFDLLGLGELSKLEATLALIKQLYDIELDLWNLDWTDTTVWDLIASGDTLGLFQLGSPGMTRALIQIAPRDLNELAMVLALYRPGPMGQLDEIAYRKKGIEEVESLHPSLDAILEPTYGFPVYQEQLIEIIVTVAGFSRGEADLIRKAIGKKKRAELAKHESDFKSRAVSRGYHPDDVARIWGFIAPFADYGFNLAHAMVYAYAAFQSAFLKAYYPQAFYAAAMSVEDRSGSKKNETSQERIGAFILEAQRRGVTVLPPSILAAAEEFTPEGSNAVRYGLKAIKGLSDAGAASIVAHAPYSCLVDLVQRTETTKKDLDALIWSGTIPWGTRASQALHLETLLKLKAKRTVSKRKGEDDQTRIKRGAARFAELMAEAAQAVPPDVPELSAFDLIERELQLLGMVHSPFPPATGTITCKIAGLGSKLGPVILNGMIASLQPKISRASGKPYALVNLLDETGLVQGMVWPSCWEDCDADALHIGSFVELRGRCVTEEAWEDEESLPPLSSLRLRIDMIEVIGKPVQPVVATAPPPLVFTIPPSTSPQEALPVVTDIFEHASRFPGEDQLTVIYNGQEEHFAVDGLRCAQLSYRYPEWT